MTSLVWLGLGNLALAAPLAIVAWLSGRLARRPAITHGLWVLVLLKLVTPPIGWVPVGRFDDLERPEPAMQHPVVAREWDEWEQIAVAPTMIAPQTPTNDEVAAGLTPLNAPAGLDTTEGASTPIEQVTNNAIEEPNFADPIDSAPVAAKTNPGNGDPVPGPTSDHFAEIRPWVVPGIGGLWLAGAFVVWARFVQRSMRFRNLLANAAAAPEVVKERVARLAGELGIRAPDVVFVQSAISPLLWVSGRRAVLVLPRTLFEQLDSEQQATLLVHELAHWKRGDHWVRRLECLAGGLYWWCPLVWWAQAGVRQAEEECCDAWVTATVPGSERTYALALVETVDFLAGARTLLPPLASGLGPFPSLQRRLTMIFRTGTPKRLSLAGLIGLFGLGGLMLTWSPVPIAAQAQEGDEAKSEKKTFKLLLSGGGGAAVVQDDELPRVKKKADQPAPEKRAGQPKREALGDASAEIERLRAELRMRQAELDRLQREIDRQARELQSRIDQAGVAPAAPGPRPGAGAPPRPEPTPRLPVPPTAPIAPVQPFPPGARAGGGPGFAPGGPGFGEKGGGVNPVERRMDNLERKLDRMIEELTNLRREMSNRGGPGGPGGQGGFGGGFPGGGQGGFGGGGQGAFGGGGGGGGFGGQGGGFFKKNPPATPPGADPSQREQREPQGVVPPPVQRKKDANFESNGNTPNPAANGGLRGAGTGVRVPSPRPAAENNDGFDPAPVAPRRVDDPSQPARQSS